MNNKSKYIEALESACNEMRLDYFPQVEASELLFRVITLEDIYLPLSLSEDHYDPLPYHSDTSDIEEIMRRIDDKIKALEEMKESTESDSTDINEDNKSSKNNSTAEKETSNRQILIEADPGSGKTTFCKRLVLAFLNNDKNFFDKYSTENGLTFNTDCIPVLLCCKNISELSNEELNTTDFEQIMYKICQRDMGTHFSDFSEADFRDVLYNPKGQSICIILDGWDEILNKEKELFFCDRLKEFVNNKPQIDVVITSRFSYIVPELVQKNSRRFRICPLNEDDIRTFCQKWYKIILSPNQNRINNCNRITNQILCSKDQQVRLMMKNPLELSMLLTVSKNDGLLPENKADLFEELVDLYIFWSTNKSSSTLSSKTIRVFLAYIASHFTKNNLLICSEKTLRNLIKQALVDLEYAFSEDTSSLEPSRLAKELSHTGIFTKTYNGNRYSFSESRKGTHRQMQEYLTAYAILAQYSDEEDNNKSPIEILEDKYTLRQWREVITFIVLMKNGCVRQEIIERLISKYNQENDATLSNLLFSFIIKNADIRINNRHRIYDSIFQSHITDQQISDIFEFVNGNSKTASDFINYITEKCDNSVKEHGTDYSYAYAIIEASKAHQIGTSPIDHAYVLMRSKRNMDKLAGLKIIILFAWCKYINIRNEFASSYMNYSMSSSEEKTVKNLINNKYYGLQALKCIREAIIADFANYTDFFNQSDVENACANLSNSESEEKNAIVLSLSILLDSSFSVRRIIDSKTRTKYLEKLNDEIKKKDLDNLVFTYNICVSIGCFSLKDITETWKKVREIYLPAWINMGKAYFSKIDGIYLSSLYEQITNKYDLQQENLGDSKWILAVKTNYFYIYRNIYEDYELRIALPKGKLCNDAADFLDSELSNSHVTYNNLAYLLRRHHIREVSISRFGTDTIMTPKLLLGNAVRAFDSLSTINYALTLSNICGNIHGNYKKGKDFLLQVSPFLKTHKYYWTDAFDWWMKLAIERNEYEGLVVLTWLYVLGIFSFEYFNITQLRDLSTELSKYEDAEKDFTEFRNAIIDKLK